MSSVSGINFEYVTWAMTEINKCLLKSETGLLVQAEVDESNQIIGAKIVPIQVALQNGFEPAIFAAKEVLNAKADS